MMLHCLPSYYFIEIALYSLKDGQTITNNFIVERDWKWLFWSSYTYKSYLSKHQTKGMKEMEPADKACLCSITKEEMEQRLEQNDLQICETCLEDEKFTLYLDKLFIW